jgi:hypothetical protein
VHIERKLAVEVPRGEPRDEVQINVILGRLHASLYAVGFVEADYTDAVERQPIPGCFEETLIMLARHDAAQARTASGINIFLGICLFVSPWAFGYRAAGSVAIWNSVIVGALIAILAASNCFSAHFRTGLNWINVLLALWTMIPPLVYGSTANAGGLMDHILLAILIATFAICSDGATRTGEKHPPPRSHRLPAIRLDEGARPGAGTQRRRRQHHLTRVHRHQNGHGYPQRCSEFQRLFR